MLNAQVDRLLKAPYRSPGDTALFSVAWCNSLAIQDKSGPARYVCFFCMMFSVKCYSNVSRCLFVKISCKKCIAWLSASCYSTGSTNYSLQEPVIYIFHAFLCKLFKRLERYVGLTCKYINLLVYGDIFWQDVEKSTVFDRWAGHLSIRNVPATF